LAFKVFKGEESFVISRFYGAKCLFVALAGAAASLALRAAFSVCHTENVFHSHLSEPIFMPGTANPEFLRRAISLATQNVLEGKGGPFGAVIVHEGQIVGEGVNSVTATNDPTAHAEVIAIRAAARTLRTFDLAGCDVYSSCEPCPMCLAAAYWARIRAIYYGACAADAAKAGFDDAFLYDEMRKEHASRAIPSSQLLNEEAWASFKAWIESPNKIQY